MHKDPPPTLLERAYTDIVVHGLITGFVASLLFFGAWALFSADGPAVTRPALQVPSPTPK
jgi:hypothetical protein